MKIIGNTIHFKSSDKFYDDFYNKEKFNLKSNTVRKLTHDEAFSLGHISFICIHSTKTGYYFQRKLKDISFYDGRFIFSW